MSVVGHPRRRAVRPLVIACGLVAALMLASMPVQAHHNARIDDRIVSPYNIGVFLHLPVVAGYEPVPTPLHCADTEPQGDVVWSEDFSSLSAWTFRTTPLVGNAPNLWGRTTAEVEGGSSGHSKNGHLYFGDVGQGNYAGKGHVGGVAQGPSVTVPSSGVTSLVFETKWEVEWLKGYEHLWVEAIEPNGRTHILCSANAYDRGEASSSGFLASCSPYLYTPCPPLIVGPEWHTRSIQIPEYLQGKSLRFRFTFDSSDDVANGFAGWFVDDVRLVRGSSGFLGTGIPLPTDPNDIQQVRRAIRIVTNNVATSTAGEPAPFDIETPFDNPMPRVGAAEEPARVLRQVAAAQGLHIAPTPACPADLAALDRLAQRLGVEAPDLRGQPEALQFAVACLADGLNAANAAHDNTFAQIDAELLFAAAERQDALERLLPMLEGRESSRNLAAAAYLADRVAEAHGALAGVRLDAVQSIDQPPLLRVDATGDSYHFDNYALTLELAGDDTYDNHAGGILATAHVEFDKADDRPGGFRAGVAGAKARVGDGIQDADAGVTASLVLDIAGNDVYGVRHAPRYGDELCTSEWLNPLALAQGAGLGGVGMLIDTVGDNTFTARAQSQGVGHILGVGVLAVGDGHDAFQAVRSAQGQGLLGGVGILVDTGGDSEYLSRAPLGGTHNNDLAVCDDVPRYAQGSAFDRRAGPLLPSIGLLIDRAGDDVYESGELAQGFGQGPGMGMLIDQAGHDTYTATAKSQGAAQGRSRDFNPQAPWGNGLGVLIDAAGADRYILQGEGQGWSLGDPTAPDAAALIPWAVDRNEAVGILVDRSGDDTYTVPGRDDGAARVEGLLGVFLDQNGAQGVRPTIRSAVPTVTGLTGAAGLDVQVEAVLGAADPIVALADAVLASALP